MDISVVSIGNILTRTSGFLRTVTSHSLQPYRGCSFGNSLCGVGCYVQHSRHILQGRTWGGFLEIRANAADSYREHYERERRWARRSGPFSIFCSSATDPFLPQEERYGVTARLLAAMCERPPDELIVQTHTHLVVRQIAALQELARGCRLRVHVSIETDRERFEGLPPHASSVARRFDACAALRAAGLPTVVTVSPLLPIGAPEAFFQRIAQVADAVVIDHFIEGDGSVEGRRTFQTPLPAVMESVLPGATSLSYRDDMAAVARRHLPGRVGISIDGFAGRFTAVDPETFE